MKKYVKAANGLYNITDELLLTRPLRISKELRDALVDTDTWVIVDKWDKVWYINHSFFKELTDAEFNELKDTMKKLYPDYTYEDEITDWNT